MNNSIKTTLILSTLIAVFYVPSAQAYFKTIEGINNIHTQRALPTSYTNRISVFRSQRGRKVLTYPTMGSYTSILKGDTTTSDEKARANIRSLFGQDNLSQNNSNSQYDNNQFNDSKIKFRTMVTHRCFEPIGVEILRCKEQFGTFFNLKASILNGNVYEILVTNNPDISSNITELYQDMVQEIKNNDAKPIVKKEVKSTMLLRDRMQLVWDACKAQTSDHMAAARCYISRDRLYLDNSLLGQTLNFLQ